MHSHPSDDTAEVALRLATACALVLEQLGHLSISGLGSRAEIARSTGWISEEDAQRLDERLWARFVNEHPELATDA